MLIGYVRVSTSDQNLDLQMDALKTAGCDKIHKDIASGAKDDRTGLLDVLTYIRKGDTLVVWKLDRLVRSFDKWVTIRKERRTTFPLLVYRKQKTAE